MNSARKPHAVRDKELRLAIKKIERTKGDGKLVTFAAVANEAGVSTSLIHNCFPQVAKAIRKAQGRTSEKHLDDQRVKLLAAEAKVRQLQADARKLYRRVAQLASINEVLLAELRTLKSGMGRVMRMK